MNELVAIRHALCDVLVCRLYNANLCLLALCIAIREWIPKLSIS